MVIRRNHIKISKISSLDFKFFDQDFNIHLTFNCHQIGFVYFFVLFSLFFFKISKKIFEICSFHLMTTLEAQIVISNLMSSHVGAVKELYYINLKLKKYVRGNHETEQLNNGFFFQHV